MKKYLCIIVVILIVTNYVNAQCDYADDSDAPKELFRKRLKDKESGFRYGNPYTMFARKEGFDLPIALNQIRENIVKITPILKTNLYDYSRLYKDIWENANYVEPSKCGYDNHCAHPLWVKK